MKTYKWIAALVAIGSLVAGCVCAQPPEPTAVPTKEPEPTNVPEPTEAMLSIVVGTNAEYPPFEYVDDDGNIVGFDVDLMNAIAAEADFEVEWINTRWDGIFVALASGEFDAVISAATITEERKETVDFSDPYFNAGQVIVVRADETEITGPEDLAGKKAGVQLGTTGDIWLSEETEAEVVRFDENTLAFQALANGDVDAAVADGPTAVDIVKANPEMNLKVLDGVYTDEEYGIAVNKDKPEVLGAINSGLAAVKASGKYDEIYDKYFVVEVAAPVDLGIVKVGTNAEYPPFEFVNDDGDIVGFDIELMNAIAAEADFEVEWVNTRWDGIFVALASGEFDCVISAATITEERKETVDFSDPYFNAGQVIVVRADETEITGPEDLAGKKAGVQLGTTGDIWLSEETEAEVVRFDENTLAFQALANGDVDAAVADGPTAVDIVKANPEMNLKVLDGVYTDEEYGIAVNKDRPELLAAINRGLAAVKASGMYEEIHNKYFSTE
jgi:glutamine transport system permease protein